MSHKFEIDKLEERIAPNLLPTDLPVVGDVGGAVSHVTGSHSSGGTEACPTSGARGSAGTHLDTSSGTSTPRVKEKVSQYLKEGDLICVVEEMAGLEIELPEQELRDVKVGQPLELKARSLPFEKLESTVERIAPSAKDGDVQSSVVVYTHLKNPPPMLKPGMTGYARIECDSQPVAKICANKVLRYVRTEFWW